MPVPLMLADGVPVLDALTLPVAVWVLLVLAPLLGVAVWLIERLRLAVRLVVGVCINEMK